MKKIIIIALISFISLPVLASEPEEEIFKDLINVQETFFQSSIVPTDPDVIVKNKKNYDSDSAETKNTEKFVKHMPLFKKIRLRVQNSLRVHNQKVEARDLQREYDRMKAEEEKERKNLESLDIKYLEYAGNSELQVSDKDKKSQAEPEQKIELVGGVKENITEKEMQLDCDTVVMNEETGDIEALGNPILTLVKENITLTSDKMTYNRDSNILKAIGNVVLKKDGTPIYGDYMQVNFNEENIFMDNVTAEQTALKISAKNAESDQGKLILNDGKMYSEKSHKLHLETQMVGPDFSKMIVPEEERSSLFEAFGGGENQKIRIVADQINVKADKEHDVYQVKDAEVYYKDKYLFTWPSFTAYTNKQREYFEANYPELGSQSLLGMYLGPGVVLPAPYGSTLKLIPLINYKNKLGFGGAAKFKSAFNDTQIIYGSASDTWVIRGRQELDENLFLQYGSNAYLDDWWMGSRMSKYNAELVYNKPKRIRNFLYDNADLRYTQRASIGYAQDGERNMRSERLRSSGLGTLRVKYMTEVNQTLFKIRNEEERKELSFGLVMQGSAAVYGTGDMQFVGRLGPRVHSQYKRWMQDVGYFASAISDHTPMPVYDKYRYGHSGFYLREAFRVCKYLSVGWSGYINILKDSPNRELFQENVFIVSIGPDDFKINLGYDIMRESTYFSLSFILDSKNTTVEFDRMEIKNPERLGQSEKKQEDSSFVQTTASAKTGKPVLQYAEVIDIEDPDKESI